MVQQSDKSDLRDSSKKKFQANIQENDKFLLPLPDAEWLVNESRPDGHYNSDLNAKYTIQLELLTSSSARKDEMK